MVVDVYFTTYGCMRACIALNAKNDKQDTMYKQSTPATLTVCK
jgi:hypothetical protein